MSPATETKARPFGNGNEPKACQTASLYVAGVCACLLLLLTVSLLSLAPLNLQSKNSQTRNTSVGPVVLFENGHSRSNSKRCEDTIQEYGIGKCKVSCVGITSGTGVPPGQIIVQDVKKLYESYSGTCLSWMILIKDTKFPDNKIDRNWFVVEDQEKFPPISDLQIEECPGLKEIEGGALENFPFGSNLEILTLVKNSEFLNLADGMTDGLKKLKRFEMRQNAMIRQVGSNLFSPFANTLENVEIRGGAETPQMIAQLLGNCMEKNLPKLQVVELSGSEGTGMQHLGAYQISAMQKVTSLFLYQSGIKVIDVDAFRGITTSLVLLSLANNELENLPEGIFDGMGVTRPSILYLAGNKWRCDCHLQWLQKLLTESNTISLIDDARCQSPEAERGKSLLSANFGSSCPEMPSQPPLEETCPGVASTTEQSIQTTSWPVTTETDPNPTNTTPWPATTETDPNPTNTTPESTTSPEFECEDLRSHFNQRRHIFKPLKSSRFTIKEVGDDKLEFAVVEINTGDGPAMTLVWHRDGETLECKRGVTGVERVGGLLKGRSYVFCLYDEESGIETPTQCQGKSTLASWEDRAWIENDQRTFWVAMFTVIALGCIAAGAGVALCTIWRILRRKETVARVNSHPPGTVFRPVVPLRPANLPCRVDRINSTTSYLSIMSATDISVLRFTMCKWFDGMQDEHFPPHYDDLDTLSFCEQYFQDGLERITECSDVTYI